MDEDKFRVALFDGTNFSDWKYRVRCQLAELDLLAHITTPLKDLLEPHIEKDHDTPAQKRVKEERCNSIKRDNFKCINTIVARIQNRLLEAVKEKETAHEMWKALTDRFESRTTTARMTLTKEWYQLRYRPRQENLQAYCLKFDRIVRELKQAGRTIHDEDIVIQFLLSMPP